MTLRISWVLFLAAHQNPMVYVDRRSSEALKTPRWIATFSMLGDGRTSTKKTGVSSAVLLDYLNCQHRNVKDILSNCVAEVPVSQWSMWVNTVYSL